MLVARDEFPILTSLYFFFSGYRDHPDLHSFPTRRSSDLLHHEFVVQVRSMWDARGHLRQPGDTLMGFLTSWLGDRKSTRLNSSHLGISYAVFCLKKKKKKTQKKQEIKGTH